MKSLEDFRNILLEEEKSDYKQFDQLVRAGLANKAQIQKIHRVLDKMKEDKPVLTSVDRAIVQDLLNKMVDVVTNNKQIFQQTRRAVREDIVDTSDFKIDKTGRKYKAHRIKIGDTPAADGSVELAKEEAIQLQERIDPPFVLVLKRKAIRMYPEGTKIALYYNERLRKYFSVPYSDEAGLDSPIQAEETELEEAVDAIGQLQKIKDTHQHGTVNHKDGSASKVDAQTAHAVLTVHKSLNDENKKKFADMVSRSAHHMQKAAEFSWKQMK
jgi:hypothetical protein